MLVDNLSLAENIFDSPDQKAIRDGFGEGIVEAGEENENVMVLTADLEESTRVTEFAKKFPDRFLEVGVAEQSMVTVASGLAVMGKIPFATSFASFSPGRNWEQIRTTIALNNVPVKIVSSHSGLSVGEDGATHQALEDIALMRTLPNMIVLVPSDAEEAKKATLAAAKNGLPTYLRLARHKSPAVTSKATPFKIGKANAVWESKSPKAGIIVAGPLLYEALLAAKELSESGVDTILVNSPSVKPLDEQTILRVARSTGALVTVEDHQIAGGLGGAVSELVSQVSPVPIEFVGVKDTFGESGTPFELYHKHAMDKEGIIESVKKVILRKES